MVGRGVFDFQSVGDLFGARRGEGGKRPLRMEILQRPDQKLGLVWPAAPVAAGTAARGGAKKSERTAGWSGLRRGGSDREHSQGRGEGEEEVVSPRGADAAGRRVAVARVARVVLGGGVVAYPTEGVYGLGCAAVAGDAVRRVLALKGRDAGRGLIVIAASMEQIEPYIAALRKAQRPRLEATGPGPVTWIVPARPDSPEGLTGGRDTLAVRVTAHPLASALCSAAGVPLVSTSANLHGRRPARTALAVRRVFGDSIDDLLVGPCGPLVGPTEIRDLASGRVLRPAPAVQP